MTNPVLLQRKRLALGVWAGPWSLDVWRLHSPADQVQLVLKRDGKLVCARLWPLDEWPELQRELTQGHFSQEVAEMIRDLPAVEYGGTE